MDIRMFLDMDDMDVPTAPAPNSSIDLVALPSNADVNSSGRYMPRIPRSHLLPMLANAEATHGCGLLPLVKSWPQGCSSPEGSKSGTNSHCISTPSVLRYLDHSYFHSPPLSFQNNHGSIGLQSTSLAQSTEDIQWDMYLTSSLSNPSDDAEFDETPPTLSYPKINEGEVSTPNPLCEPWEADSSPATTMFPLGSDPDIFGLLPVVHSPLSASFMSSHVVPSSCDSGVCSSPQVKLETPIHDQTFILPNGTYASLLEVTPPTLCSSATTSPEMPSLSMKTVLPSFTSSSLRGRSPIRGAPLHGRNAHGLSGWGDTGHLQLPMKTTQKKRPRSISKSPSAAMRRPYPNSPYSLRTSSHATDSIHESKRPRISPASAPPSDRELDANADDRIEKPADDADSDDYCPSRSSSPEISVPVPNFHSKRIALTKRKVKRSKGKAKGSAALALAVVTQLGARSCSGSEVCEDSDLDVLALYREGKVGIRKRKNHPIPLPIPVPNLHKKSRGRKVPHLVDVNAEIRETSVGSSALSCSSIKEEEVEGAEESGQDIALRGSRRFKRKALIHESVDDELAGSRTYVCVVNGCGKCFVRSEHLKRHVRSIHTHDKPHQCPYEGCDKSFSRRDNLGQHVRIHLQS